MISLNYNSVFTTNIKEYKQLLNSKYPIYSTNYIHNCSIITNLTFGKLYYIFYDNNLIAFKLIAFSVREKDYLMETPNGLLWLNLNIYKVFYTKGHYFDYLEGKQNPIEFISQKIDLCNIPNFTLNTTELFKIELKTSYKWDKSLGKPIKICSRIYDILYTENGFVVYHELSNESFYSYQECLCSNLNGMKIVDFDEEETTFHFNIKTETKSKIHVLRFVEE